MNINQEVEVQEVEVQEVEVQQHPIILDGIVLEGHTSKINSVAFSPDGSTLASGSNDKDDSPLGYCHWKTQGDTCRTYRGYK